ncbi:MAG: hypothetical protein V3575_04320 [Candidatus Absconditabacteria bacterium]
MNKTVKIIMNGFLFGLFGIIGIFSGWKIITALDADLVTVNNGDTLTSTSYNNIVNKLNSTVIELNTLKTQVSNLSGKNIARTEVPSTDTENFDVECLRRYYIENGTADGYFYPRYVYAERFLAADPFNDWIVEKGTKNYIYKGSDPTTKFYSLKIEKACP